MSVCSVSEFRWLQPRGFHSSPFNQLQDLCHLRTAPLLNPLLQCATGNTRTRWRLTKRKNIFFCSGDLIIAVGPFLSPSLLFPGYASERSAAACGPLPPSLSLSGSQQRLPLSSSLSSWVHNEPCGTFSRLVESEVRVGVGCRASRA